MVEHMCSLRRTYVQLYAESLQQKSRTESEQIREIEDKVDLQVLLLWRYVFNPCSTFTNKPLLRMMIVLLKIRLLLMEQIISTCQSRKLEI